MSKFATGLRFASRLRVLDLHDSVWVWSIGAAGVTALASALCHLSRLESLNCERTRAHVCECTIKARWRGIMLTCARVLHAGTLVPDVIGGKALALGLRCAVTLTSLNLEGTVKPDWR